MGTPVGDIHSRPCLVRLCVIGWAERRDAAQEGVCNDMAENRQLLMKRILFYALGLLVMTFGIALSSKAGLGVAPVSTIAFAGSHLIPLTFGMCSTSFHAFCFLAQFVLTRRMTVMILLQIPASYVFGLLIDFFSGLLRFTAPNIASGAVLIAVSACIFSLGIRIILGSNLVLPPPDSLVRVIGELVGWPMSKSKLVFDIAIVTLSAVLTLVFLGNPFVAVGVGTVVCVALTGPAIGFFQRKLPFFDIS